MTLHSVDICGVQASKPFFHVEEFLLVLPIAFIDLAFKELYLLIELCSIFGVLFEGNLQLVVKIVDFLIFEGNDLPQSIELILKFIILGRHTFLEIP